MLGDRGARPPKRSAPGRLDMHLRITVRYGRERTRYHTEQLEAEGLREALVRLADVLPDQVLAEGDLIEIRPSPDPEGRDYVEDPSGA